MKQLFIFAIAMILFVSAKGQEEWQNIPASHPSIQYMGRVELQDNKAMFNWPGVVISARFTGSELGIRIKGGSRNYFNVWVDDRQEKVLHAVNDTVWWYPEYLERGEHKLRLVKRTEADMGMAVFSGIYIGKKESLLMPVPLPERKILFIGNSITCGYGAEGKDKTESFLPETENCEKSYATIIARAFGAQYQLISHSGLGMVRNYGDKQRLSVKIKPMPARLEYLFDKDSTKQFNLNLFKPDAVVINLGTNDFSTQPFPYENDFTEAGVKLIQKIRSSFPGVKVFCITGPMINEPCYSYTKKIVESVRTEMNTSDIIFVGVPKDLLNTGSDLGSDWHPSYKGQIKVTKLILPVISTVLDWNYVSDELK
ncbi:MAG: endoglucanase [Labilibaculum sp.]|nr:endoglucanase [Labilibaculum sp.]